MTKIPRTDKKLTNYLAGFDKKGLTALILELAKELPEVRQALNDRLLFRDGKAAKLIEEAEAAIATVGEVDGYRDRYGWFCGDDADWPRITQLFEGIAAQGEIEALLKLGEQLIAIKGRSRDWAQVAALQADGFFLRPNLKGYQEVKRTAGKAKAAEPVCAALLDYLAEGGDPRTGKHWPLPAPLTSVGSASLTPKRAPATELLIDIAIAEQRVDDVLRWHWIWKNANAHRLRYSRAVDGAVADAVANSYPEEAIAIWKEIAADLIAETKPASYRSARAYLERIKARLSGLKRGQEWSSYLAALKREHQRKRRLMEELRGL